MQHIHVYGFCVNKSITYTWSFNAFNVILHLSKGLCSPAATKVHIYLHIRSNVNSYINSMLYRFNVFFKCSSIFFMSLKLHAVFGAKLSS